MRLRCVNGFGRTVFSAKHTTWHLAVAIRLQHARHKTLSLVAFRTGRGFDIFQRRLPPCQPCPRRASSKYHAQSCLFRTSLQPVCAATEERSSPRPHHRLMLLQLRRYYSSRDAQRSVAARIAGSDEWRVSGSKVATAHRREQDSQASGKERGAGLAVLLQRQAQ